MTAPLATAGPADITGEELQLATRNHGMPLEALHYDVTPVGLHYLLIHYDIPVLDRDAWRLEVGGLVARPLTLSLDDLRARPSVTVDVTMECAGNGMCRCQAPTPSDMTPGVPGTAREPAHGPLRVPFPLEGTGSAPGTRSNPGRPGGEGGGYTLPRPGPALGVRRTALPTDEDPLP